MKISIIFFFILSLINAFLSPSPNIQDPINSLQSTWWLKAAGNWRRSTPNSSAMLGYWNGANTIEMLANSLKFVSNKEELKNVMYEYFSHQDVEGFLFFIDIFLIYNEGFIERTSYDDDGWVALSWLRAYEETGLPEYLNRTKFFFNVIKETWDQKCGGGVYWAGDKQKGFRYKNAVTNELFLMLAIRLSDVCPDPLEQSEYFSWALRTWSWFETSGMLIRNGASFTVIDGFSDSDCKPMGEYWSYNQGVILGALGRIYEKTGNSTVVEIAEKILFSVINEEIVDNPWLYQGGILKEHCEPDCDDNAKQFKGIFVRYVQYYYESCVRKGREVNVMVKNFMRKNCRTLWNYDRDGENRFGLIWKGPVDEVNPISQTIGLDLIIADKSVN